MVNFQPEDFGENSSEHKENVATVKCPHCQKIIHADSIVCPYCNSTIKEIIQVDLFPEFPYQRWRRIFHLSKVLTAVAIVALILGGYGYFSIQQFSSENYITKGDAFMVEGDVAIALDYYQKAIQYDTQNLEGYEKLAWAEYQLARDADAFGHFETALQLDANRVSSLYGAGLSAYQMREYEISISYLSRVIELNPENVGAYEYLGLAEYRLANYENAFIYLDKAWIYNPENATTIYYLGQIFAQQADLSLAVQAFNSAEQLGFDPLSVFYARGTTYLQLGSFSEAQDDFQQVLILNPTRNDAWLSLSKSSYLIGDFNKAYEQLIKVNPDAQPSLYAAYLELLGWIAIRQENTTIALDSFNRWLNLEPNDSNALNALGWATYYSGYCSNAQIYFQRALQNINTEWKYTVDSLETVDESPQAGLRLQCGD